MLDLFYWLAYLKIMKANFKISLLIFSVLFGIFLGFKMPASAQETIEPETTTKPFIYEIPLTDLKFSPLSISGSECILNSDDRDSLIIFANPTATSGLSVDLRINNRAAGKYRSILGYDISDCEIPVGATIISATIDLSYIGFDFGDPVGLTIWVYKLTRDEWVETEVSWNNYNLGNAWTIAGGDFTTSAPAGGSAIVPASHATMTWTITDIIQDAIDNEANKVNLLLKYDTEESAGHHDAIFNSREAGANDQILTINYEWEEEEEPVITIETTTYDFIDKYTDASSEASFYLDKRISYGDILLFIPLFFFLIFKIFSVCWNFIFPKSFKALTNNDL